MIVINAITLLKREVRKIAVITVSVNDRDTAFVACCKSRDHTTFTTARRAYYGDYFSHDAR
jgi:hypothetical protein